MRIMVSTGKTNPKSLTNIPREILIRQNNIPICQGTVSAIDNLLVVDVEIQADKKDRLDTFYANIQGNELIGVSMI